MYIGGYVGTAAGQTGVVTLSGTVGSGEIASGSVQGFFGTTRHIASGTVGSFDLGSGAITFGTVGSGAVVSGNVASGQLADYHFASGASIDVAGWIVEDSYFTSELISGGASGLGPKAVCFDQSGLFLLTAMASVSGRMPAIGVVTANLTSGAAATVYRLGKLYAGPTIDFSGWTNQPVYVGQSGHVVASGAPTNSGDIQQILGTSLAGSGLFLNIGDPLEQAITASGDIGSGSVQGSVGGGYFGVASGTLGPNDLGSGAILSGHVASGQLGRFHIGSGQLAGFELGSGAVVSGRIASGQLGQGHYASGSLAGSLATVHSFASGTIGPNDIGSGAVLSGHIASGQLGTFHIGSGQLTGFELGSGAVVSGRIASGQVGNFHLASGQVQGLVTAGVPNIASGTLGGFELGSGSIVSGRIASGQVGSFHFASGAVQSGNIASGQLSWPHFAGPQIKTIQVSDSPYTVLALDRTLLCYASGGNITANLPAANTVSGKELIFKKTDLTANTVTIDGNSAETIDEAATAVITTQWTTRSIQSDGSGWYIT